jgi:hypothetical protein
VKEIKNIKDKMIKELPYNSLRELDISFFSLLNEKENLFFLLFAVAIS